MKRLVILLFITFALVWASVVGAPAATPAPAATAAPDVTVLQARVAALELALASAKQEVAEADDGLAELMTQSAEIQQQNIALLLREAQLVVQLDLTQELLSEERKRIARFHDQIRERGFLIEALSEEVSELKARDPMVAVAQGFVDGTYGHQELVQLAALVNAQDVEQRDSEITAEANAAAQAAAYEKFKVELSCEDLGTYVSKYRVRECKRAGIESVVARLSADRTSGTIEAPLAAGSSVLQWQGADFAQESYLALVKAFEPELVKELGTCTDQPANVCWTKLDTEYVTIPVTKQTEAALAAKAAKNRALVTASKPARATAQRPVVVKRQSTPRPAASASKAQQRQPVAAPRRTHAAPAARQSAPRPVAPAPERSNTAYVGSCNENSFTVGHQYRTCTAQQTAAKTATPVRRPAAAPARPAKPAPAKPAPAKTTPAKTRAPQQVAHATPRVMFPSVAVATATCLRAGAPAGTTGTVNGVCKFPNGEKKRLKPKPKQTT